MNIVGYIRVSSADQAENTSITTQTKAIKEYTAKLKKKDPPLYVDIDSGNNYNRAFLWGGIKSLKSGDILLCVRPDRLSRNAKHALLILDAIHERGAELQFTELSLDLHTAAGRLIFTILTAAAEHERDMIHARTNAGRAAVRAAGGILGGPSPYGSKRRGGRDEPVNSERLGVERILGLRKLGHSLRDIARILTGEGIPTKKGRNWSHQSVAKIISRLKKKKPGRDVNTNPEDEKS